MTFVVMETNWVDAKSGDPVVTEALQPDRSTPQIVTDPGRITLGRLADKVASHHGCGGRASGSRTRNASSTKARRWMGRRDQRRERAAGAMQVLQAQGGDNVALVRTDISDPRFGAELRRPDGRAVRNRAQSSSITPRSITTSTTSTRANEYLLKVFSVNQHGTLAHGPRRRAGHGQAALRADRQPGRRLPPTRTCSPPFSDDFTGLGNYSYSITSGGIVGLTKFLAAHARTVEHHRELHRARRHHDRGDEEDRSRHVTSPA